MTRVFGGLYWGSPQFGKLPHSQGAQYALVKIYTLNGIRVPNIF